MCPGDIKETCGMKWVKVPVGIYLLKVNNRNIRTRYNWFSCVFAELNFSFHQIKLISGSKKKKRIERSENSKKQRNKKQFLLSSTEAATRGVL